jgi:excisionase family DNA binding protein
MKFSLQRILYNALLDLVRQLISRILAKPVLDIAETARYLKISESHLYKLISQKQIPHYCPQGNRIYFNREELDQWLMRNRQSSSDDIDSAASDYIIRNRRR